MVAFEDILITPLNYESPIKEQINSLYTNVYKTFGQYLFVEMELVKIETSTNIIGFDFLTEPKNEDFIKYYSLEIGPEPGYNLDDEKNDYPVCEVEFTLNDKVLVEKRQYIQFLDMLGEIGGLMEFLSSFFGLICNIIGDLLYEKTIANNLFSFDIKNKLILIKKRNNSIFNFIPNKTKEKVSLYNIKESFNISNNHKKLRKKITFMDDNNIREIKSKNSENSLIRKKNLFENQLNKNDVEIDKETNNKESQKSDIKNSNNKKLLDNFSTKKKTISLNNKNKNEYLIDIINLRDLFISICFCFSKKRKNIYKILLNETKEIITEKLDIFNIFRDLCSIEAIRKNSDVSDININMSDNCSNYFREIIL